MMILSRVFLFGLFLLVTFAECHIYRYDYKYYEELDGWLKFHRVPDNFTSAFMRCHAEGAILAYPNGEPMQQAMSELNTENGNSCGIFTGINCIISQGDYTATEGLPLDKIEVTWAQNEPHYENNEQCTVMLQNGTLATAECNATFPYICYRKEINVDHYKLCGTVDGDYSLDNRTGSCYKFHRVGRTWRQAYRICLAEGGYLAVINNALEAEVMKEIFAKYPKENIDAHYKDVVSVGFYDIGERTWLTIHGQYLSEVYSTFAAAQPDALASTCGGMFRSSQFDDIYCNNFTIPFICEKSPVSLYDKTVI